MRTFIEEIITTYEYYRELCDPEFYEGRIPYEDICSYCQDYSRERGIWYNNICPECFEIDSDQSVKERLEAEIKYQLLMNQLNDNKHKNN